MPTLLVLHPDGTETEHRFDGTLSIGRHEANGTYVEGTRLEAPCVLAPGLEVQLGDYVLRLAPPPRPGRSARIRTEELPTSEPAGTDELPAVTSGEAAATLQAAEPTAGSAAEAAVTPDSDDLPGVSAGRPEGSDALAVASVRAGAGLAPRGAS